MRAIDTYYLLFDRERHFFTFDFNGSLKELNLRIRPIKINIKYLNLARISWQVILDLSLMQSLKF